MTANTASNRYSNLTANRYREVIAGMAQESVFGLHTAEFKKWISRKEANSIKAYFNLNPDEKLTGSTYFYQDGITKLWIEEVKGKKPRYYLHMIINFSRVLGISNYKAMPYTLGNVKKVFTAMNKVLKALPLSGNNAVFPDWTRERLDSVFDIYEEHTELQMQLLNQSVNPFASSYSECKIFVTLESHFITSSESS
ncbi:MAG: hypothetical protein HFH32_19230 [Eubacterium sp.]|nr:hypothetical protein [Eubacterium sp.]